ncbi:hypothetical protein Rs2_42663 [Raphanus sativus]|nr:hypothetical protein Rs2_42663 [Raphanus sativus]
MEAPTFSDDGIPVVKAPQSVIFRSTVSWDGYLVAQFHGTAPSLTKVFSDLDPIWGKNGRIRVKHHSKNVCLIFIPCKLTRNWVLDVGFWHSGNCAFSVSKWTPTLKISPMKLEHAPVWVLFRRVPPKLWSLEGFSTIATGVGFPVQSEFSNVKPYSNGVVKLKVVIKLEGKKAYVVKVVDKVGNTVSISTEYLKLPHKCKICSEFGHSELRCPDRSKNGKQTPPKRAAPTVVPEKRTSSSASSKTSAKSHAHPASGKEVLRRSSSLPSSVGGRSTASKGLMEWIPVAVRSSPPKKTLSISSAVLTILPVTLSQFASEEELIAAAQKIIRSRTNVLGSYWPPFTSVNDRKAFRKFQRQTFRQLCEDDPDPGALEVNSDSVTNHLPVSSSVEAASAPPQPVEA